jgi:hypothetical protein
VYLKLTVFPQREVIDYGRKRQRKKRKSKRATTIIQRTTNKAV